MADSINIKNHGSLGLLWFIGWLFSIGFLKLGIWKSVLAFLVWPYFLAGDVANIRGTEPVEEISDQHDIRASGN
ncbi:MAG: hypothetical protein AAGD92_06830 [Pseudomonadota bacterium]